MIWVALKMLLGDRAKYLGLIGSIAFSTMLMSQQVCIFWGLMLRTTSQIQDVREPDIWVMDPNTTNIDDSRPLRKTAASVVRGVEGVDWAVPLTRVIGRLRIPEGSYRQTLMIGVEDDTLIGGPQEMLMGNVDALRSPETIILDKAGYEYLWPNEPLALGRVVEFNDRRAVVGGICQTSAPFVTLPVAYARRNQVSQFLPNESELTSFVVAKARTGFEPGVVASTISAFTPFKALRAEDFSSLTIDYYMNSTGIPVNFGITVSLAFIVGAAIAGQTFFLFTLENLKQFGALKAMGVTNWRILGMILAQALVVGVLGYAIGLGMATAFFEFTKDISHLRGFFLYWQVGLGTAFAVLLIMVATAVICVRKVFVLEPAVVFRG